MQRFAKIDPETKLQRFVEACRTRGLSVTHQRLAIYGVLAQTEEHPSAERIYDLVRRQYPTISLATVYKTLDTLEAIGLISKVNNLHESARFDANRDRHHHLVCTKCHKVIDFYDEDLASLPVPERVLGGAFRVTDYQLQLNGLCGDCSAQAGA